MAGPGKDIDVAIKIKNIPFLEGEYVLGLYINDDISGKDFFNLFRFNIWPVKKLSNEIPYEYDLVYRGYMNLDFEVLTPKP